MDSRTNTYLGSLNFTSTYISVKNHTTYHFFNCTTLYVQRGISKKFHKSFISLVHSGLEIFCVSTLKYKMANSPRKKRGDKKKHLPLQTPPELNHQTLVQMLIRPPLLHAQQPLPPVLLLRVNPCNIARVEKRNHGAKQRERK